MNTRPRQQILTVIAIALTFASGAADVASFTRLGAVFTSVMTGNIVLWGLAVARGSLTLASKNEHRDTAPVACNHEHQTRRTNHLRFHGLARKVDGDP